MGMLWPSEISTGYIIDGDESLSVPGIEVDAKDDQPIPGPSIPVNGITITVRLAPGVEHISGAKTKKWKLIGTVPYSMVNYEMPIGAPRWADLSATGGGLLAFALLKRKEIPVSLDYDENKGSLSTGNSNARIGDIVTYECSSKKDDGYVINEIEIYDGKNTTTVSGDGRPFITGHFTIPLSISEEVFEISATFKRPKIKVKVNTIGYGTVSSRELTVEAGSNYQITATPDNYRKFLKWTKDGQDVAGGETITCKAGIRDEYLTAYFSSDLYVLTVRSGNIDFGTVSGHGTYSYGQHVILSANPYHGYEFAYWDNEQLPNYRRVTYIVKETETITAYFRRKQIPMKYTVSQTIDFAPDGSVIGEEKYDYDTDASLLAVANSGFEFVHWLDVTGTKPVQLGTDNPLVLRVKEQKTIEAIFQKKIYSVTIKAGEHGYLVGGDINGNYEYGTELTIAAKGDDGYHFDSWDGAPSYASSGFKIKVSSIVYLTAKFVMNQSSLIYDN